jgi:hypothetical protein
MGEVIELRPRVAANDETRLVLADMLAKDGTGELEGSICIAATGHGTEIHILGTCADRLQMGVLALVRAANFMCDKIVASGTAGDTRGKGPIKLGVPNPHRGLPKRLREATNFGELE